MNESDLLRLLESGETHFVERKTANDKKDWVKTIVAFANSLTVEQLGLLFIGVRNGGEIEFPQVNLDSLQKTLTDLMLPVYPSVPFTTNEVERDGKKALAVVVYGSPLKPHFPGHAYVRSGSESIAADAPMYERFVAERKSKTAMLLKWKGRMVTVTNRQSNGFETEWPGGVTLMDANQFWVTLNQGDDCLAFALGRVELAFDYHQR